VRFSSFDGALKQPQSSGISRPIGYDLVSQAANKLSAAIEGGIMQQRFALAFVALIFVGLTAPLADAAPQQAPSPSFDIASPLESRIGGAVPASTLKSYADSGRGVLTTHVMTEAEKRQVAAALAALTPLQRRIAQEHLRSISFANGMMSNAQTARSTLGAAYPEFEIVLNPVLLKETVSEFLTRKERQLFDTTGSTLSVSVDGGSMDAVTYVLIHETTHMVDMSLGLAPQGYYKESIPDDAHTPVTRGIWASTFKLVAPYHDAIFERVNFAPNAKTIPIAEAQSLYEALGRTPLVSIYASRGYPEDLPEFVAWRQMTRKLNQPYRIEIRDGGRVVYSFEPMKNPLVQNRLGLLERFDS
jgi:hypothetical protein